MDSDPQFLLVKTWQGDILVSSAMLPPTMEEILDIYHDDSTPVDSAPVSPQTPISTPETMPDQSVPLSASYFMPPPQRPALGVSYYVPAKNIPSQTVCPAHTMTSNLDGTLQYEDRPILPKRALPQATHQRANNNKRRRS